MKNYLIMAGIGLVMALGVVMIVPRNVINQASQLGSVASPDILSPYFSFGGVRYWGARTSSMVAATTTVCALQSPAATSTLLWGSVSFAVSTTSASVVTMAKAATAFATTTSLGQVSLAAGAQGTIIIASSSPNNVSVTDGLAVFSPSQYLVVGMQGNGANTYSPTGTCQAVWAQTTY